MFLKTTRDPNSYPSEIYGCDTDQVEKEDEVGPLVGGGRDETADTSHGGEEGGLDGESRLAGRVVVVVSPWAGGAGERSPGSGGRRGAPGEGRREPPSRNPQHLVAGVVFLRRFGGGSLISARVRSVVSRKGEDAGEEERE